jgi:hypothetical protein
MIDDHFFTFVCHLPVPHRVHHTVAIILRIALITTVITTVVTRFGLRIETLSQRNKSEMNLLPMVITFG